MADASHNNPDKKPRLRVTEELRQLGRLLGIQSTTCSGDTEPSGLFNGQMINGYKLTGMMGTGGQSEVWAAVDSSAQLVAIKLFLGEQAEKYHELECECLELLKGIDGVAQFVSQGKTRNKLPYLAREYVDGEPLDKILEHSGRLSGDSTREILVQLLEILSVVHQQKRCISDHGLCHSDIKPANIIIDPSNKPVFIDFGIARELSADNMHLRHGSTYVYRVPKRYQDTRADLFQVALIGFEMLVGKRYWELEDAQDNSIEALPDPLSRLDSPKINCRRELKEAIKRGLSLDVRHNFHSADEFISAIQGNDITPAPRQMTEHANVPKTNNSEPTPIKPTKPVTIGRSNNPQAKKRLQKKLLLGFGIVCFAYATYLSFTDNSTFGVILSILIILAGIGVLVVGKNLATKNKDST